MIHRDLGPLFNQPAPKVSVRTLRNARQASAEAVTAWVRVCERRRERRAFDCPIRPGDALIVSGHTSNEARINGVWRKP